MTRESDKTLWNKVRSGDKDAYAFVYERYGRQLFSYGSYFSMDEELIKDCIQEIFVRIYQNHSKLGETDNIRFYLYYALKNELLQELRKKSRLSELNPELLVFSTNSTVEKQFIEKESSKLNKQKVTQMLNELPARQREIVYYRYIEELSFDEICKLMNLNYQSAQNLIHRSIKKLRTIIQIFIIVYIISVI
ncbi:RNA polymerase sigma factor [Dysgonomonas hofstadii]|uniref:RNA polymerase sigma factor n=1 Tax=Dysgonomonas hofstadii TaxID=637886 RepID=UPI000B1ECB69|nr:sigma-70 family RNA polymerase sigma factor [Dysgonomonas hofstadii]